MHFILTTETFAINELKTTHEMNTNQPNSRKYAHYISSPLISSMNEETAVAGDVRSTHLTSSVEETAIAGDVRSTHLTSSVEDSWETMSCLQFFAKLQSTRLLQEYVQGQHVNLRQKVDFIKKGNESTTGGLEPCFSWSQQYLRPCTFSYTNKACYRKYHTTGVQKSYLWTAAFYLHYKSE